MATTKLRAALAELLPVADSIDNSQMSDVIGNKDDTINGTSIVATIRRAEGRLNNASKVYPSLADGVVVTGAAGAWTLGDAVEIVPADTITESFLIYWVNIEATSASDVFCVALYSGAAADTEICRFRVNKDTGFPQAGDSAVSTEILAANTKISAKCANKAGGSETVTLSIQYVEII